MSNAARTLVAVAILAVVIAIAAAFAGLVVYRATQQGPQASQAIAG